MPAGKGFFLFKSKLTKEAQQEIVSAARRVVIQAPLFRPTMPVSGQPFGYSMTNCGDVGWVADKKGYRYQDNHPETGKSFPAMPQVIQKLALALAEGTWYFRCGSFNFTSDDTVWMAKLTKFGNSFK